MNPILRITDGTTIVNLFENGTKGAGFFLLDWTPLASPVQDEGVYQQSPFGQGRQLVAYQWGNTVQTLALGVNGADQDAVIRDTQKLRRLLVKALNYWASEWQSEPVWIEKRGKSETNIEYGLLKGYSAPGDDNPFQPPFAGADPVTIEDFTLILEHAPWTANRPGVGTCVELSGTQPTNTTQSFFPAGSTDDAYIEPSTISFTDGLWAGKVFTISRSSGIRFRSVEIPPGATIIQAFIRLQSIQSLSGTTVNVQIRGERNATPAAFSTYADFVGRIQTNTYLNDGIFNLAMGVGETITTQNIAAVVQEIIDLGGWASGNDLVLFLNDNGSSSGGLAIRRFSDYDNTVYAPPELVVIYESPDLLGRTATCDPEVYLANKQNTANITDIYYYDDGTASFSANLMSAAVPFELFPSTPAVDDILYIMMDISTADFGPFCSVVWDILAVQENITGVAYEIYTGSWTALTIIDNTAIGGIPFSSEGVNSMHWVQPAAWTNVNINGVDALAIRIRITSVGASPTAPTQQNRSPYTITWGNVAIDDGQVPGDIPALARHKIFTQTGDSLVPDLFSQRILIGLRSIDRGSGFVSFLNFSDVQNPPGIVGADSGLSGISMVTDVRSPTVHAVEYAVSGSDTLRDVGYITLNSTIIQHFYGRFRAFLRLTVDTGTVGTIGVQMAYGYNSSTGRSETPLVTLNYIDEWLLVDFGQIVVPGTNILTDVERFGSFTFVLKVVHTDDIDLKLYDLVLIPVDEWAGDFRCGLINSITAIDTDDYLDVDSVLNPKANLPVRALQKSVDDNDVISIWQAVNSQPAILQANADQKIYLLSGVLDSSSDKQQSFGYMAHKIQTECQPRYLSMRGNN